MTLKEVNCLVEPYDTVGTREIVEWLTALEEQHRSINIPHLVEVCRFVGWCKIVKGRKMLKVPEA